MLKNLIVLPDGTEVFSGAGEVNALQSVTLTQRVNAGTELNLGSACANMLEATLITPAGGLNIMPGMELTLYKVAEDGTRRKIGLFTAEKPTRPSANLYNLTAYDRISWLDRDLTQWLESLNGWPYTLLQFAQMVCSACNVKLVNESIPNGDWQIQKFSANGITGRQIMTWIGQASGQFCRATADGEIEFAWYTPTETEISAEGAHPILSVQFADYQVTPVDKVQIRQTETDIGGICGAGSNAYVITGNCLLATDTLEPVQRVAQQLLTQLQEVTYVPCKVRIPATTAIAAGDIVRLTDRNGKTFPLYVMTKVQAGQTDTLECVGSAYRNSTTATNYDRFTSPAGKVLEMQMSMEGIKAENRDRDGKLTALTLTVDALQARAVDRETEMEKITERMSAVEQTATGLSVQVQSVQNDGVTKVSTATGYTFDEEGITVEKSGREIRTQITEDGMRVFKNGNAVLTARSDGVNAVDLHASTYLVVGGRSRFENFETDRTGCFWVGG